MKEFDFPVALVLWSQLRLTSRGNSGVDGVVVVDIRLW